ncbi:hypothetical protein T069G_10168 [Trichoderma breve]|uniref:Uncharacterized protein n=1 Tax=Trichoderma breve TaxID=2034170 RepID=A0A9W9BAJ8_9HYPO|nr:hypothetical protein T069G_10168 [Trichoderma breve]KAJ4856800.1 hypothetical protein T069G_10168 [Trichoderma breve]
MTVPAPLHTCLVASFSSAVTIIVLLLLIRPGYDNIITTVVDRVRAPPSADVSHCPRPKECPALTPSQELSPTKFVKDPWMHPIYSRKGISNQTAFWDSLLTPNGGFLMVDLGDHRNHSVGVSMFHQLHCLSIVRSVVVGGGMHKHPNDGGGNSAMEDDQHFMHCFDYIVQAILCSADDALENSVNILDGEGGEEDGINGMGQTHKCRNATMLYDYVLQSVQVPIKPASLGKYSVFL